MAWSNSQFYARDVDPEQPVTHVNIQEFQNKFASIANHGGNSARWWFHTNGTFTPKIYSGWVYGLGQDQIDTEQAYDQLREILDAAWEEGVLLNITLFSFDMLCNTNSDSEGNFGDRYRNMLLNYHQSYIDNVLEPLVTEFKDHPALFAWEIFNESVGMTTGQHFFAEHCPGSTPADLWVFQRFVNHAAAAIHAIDPNVKVTTSVGSPNRISDFTNSELTGKSWSLPSGTLDFYQIHWYSGSPMSPFDNGPGQFNLDKPVLVGEFGYSQSGHDPNLETKLLETNGYAGGWIWDFVSVEYDASYINYIQNNIYNAAQSPIDKTAVETCIQQQNPACYN